MDFKDNTTKSYFIQNINNILNTNYDINCDLSILNDILNNQDNISNS
jgi:hypothetical protein